MKRKSQGAKDIMRGIADLEAMLRDGAKPQDRFVVRTVSLPAPGNYPPAAVKKLRKTLAMSQAVFAELLGVSGILVQSWERGVRQPSPLARRLLDTISADPAAWLSTLRQSRRAG